MVGVLGEDTDPMVSVMKLDKAPKETYADIGGLETQIQEIKESVELPLTHPEYYEEMGIKAPKGVILYGAPGTGKTLLAKAVANSTSATFLRMVGSELIQKYSGDGPKLVRELFRVAEDHSPSIVFIDEIDAVGTKRYDSTSGGEKEIQRTMLELLNQLDGFDSRGDVKVIMATNKIESLDTALIRPGRIDRKIEFPLPNEKTKRRIFGIHTGRMTLADDVNLEEFVMSKDNLSGADIKVRCLPAPPRSGRPRGRRPRTRARLAGLVRRDAAEGVRRRRAPAHALHSRFPHPTPASAPLTPRVPPPCRPAVRHTPQAICTEAGLMALRERRMKVTDDDFKKSKENVLYRKTEGTPEGLYL